MQVTVKTPPTRITATCARCGYPIHTDGATMTQAQKIFREHEWSEDEHGRAICPECRDKTEGGSMLNELLKDVKAAVTAEYERAAKTHGRTNNSPHESYAVILEEYEEALEEERNFEQCMQSFWDYVKANTATKCQLQRMQEIAEKAAAKWIQVATMCYKAQL